MKLLCVRTALLARQVSIASYHFTSLRLVFKFTGLNILTAQYVKGADSSNLPLFGLLNFL